VPERQPGHDGRAAPGRDQGQDGWKLGARKSDRKKIFLRGSLIGMAPTEHRRRPHLTTLAIRRKGVVTIPEAIRQELDLQEGDHLVATVEDGRLVLIPASVIPDDQAWFWTPEWQAKEAEADREIAEGDGTVMSADEFVADLANRAGLSPDDLA
jgi:AbrB family looped-hinge helix DNA binding protein